MAEASSLVEPVSYLLAMCRDAITSANMEGIKLVAKQDFEIAQEALDDSSDLHDIYNLLERKLGSAAAALNIVVEMLARLGVKKQLVEALREHVDQDQNELIIEGHQKMDFILTILCILSNLEDSQYTSLKNMAIEVLRTYHVPSKIKTRVHLLQLLLEQNCISPTSFPQLFAWLELVGCRMYHKQLKDYCTRHDLSEPKWQHLIPMKKNCDDSSNEAYLCSDSDLSRIDALRDSDFRDSQTYPKETTHFSISGGEATDCDNVHHDEITEVSHPESEPPIEGHQEEKSSDNKNLVTSTSHGTVNNDPPVDERSLLLKSNETSLTKVTGDDVHHHEVSYSKSESSAEEHQEESLRNVVTSNSPGTVNNDPQASERSQLLNRNKTSLLRKVTEWICQHKCCTFFIFLCIALVVVVVVLVPLAAVLGVHFLDQSKPTSTNVTLKVTVNVSLGENATVLINCYDPSNISQIVFTVQANTPFGFYAAPSSSLIATNTSFPVMRNIRTGTDNFIPLNYYSPGYYLPIYTANEGALFYNITLTQIPVTNNSCFHAYLYNLSNLDAYTDALINWKKATRFVREIYHCLHSTNEVFNFTFPLYSDGFYYVAAYAPSGMDIDARISAEIPTYNRTYLETLPSSASCQLDGDKCLLHVGNNDGINRAVHDHLCLLASSSSDTYGNVINGTVTIYY